jgi:branched-chain amino acid transport system substrate-binding protein
MLGMRRSRRALTAIAVASVSIGIAACGSGDKSGGSGNASASSASKAAKKPSPIEVAALLGPVAEGGPDFVNGMKTAIKDVNDGGGVEGRMLALKVFDTKGTPAGAVSAYRQATQDSKVAASFFAAVTGALALKGQSDAAKLPIVIATASDKVDKPAAKYVFKDSFAGEYATASIVYATKHYAAKRIAVLHYGTDYSVGISPAIKKRCAELGCQVVSDQTAAGNESADALVPALTKMRAANPDVYFIEGLDPAAFAAARQLKLDKPIVSDQWLAIPALRDACGAACNGVTFAIHKTNVPKLIADDDPLRSVFLGYRKDYEALNGAWSGFSIYGSEAVYAFAQAARDLAKGGKEITRDNLAEALQSFDGNLTTTHGVIHTSPENHRLVGTWNQAYVDVAIQAKGKTSSWVLAPGADAKGSTA